MANNANVSTQTLTLRTMTQPLGTPSAGQIRIWMSGSQVFARDAAGTDHELTNSSSSATMALNDLTNVSAATPNAGDFLIYNAANQQWEAQASSGSTPTDLNSLTDVTVTSVAQNHILRYDTALPGFVNHDGAGIFQIYGDSSGSGNAAGVDMFSHSIAFTGSTGLDVTNTFGGTTHSVIFTLNQKIQEHADVTVSGSGPTNDYELLAWRTASGSWEHGTIPINALSNVNAASPSVGHVLVWTGTEWVPNSVSNTALGSIDQLSDAATSSIRTEVQGDRLVWQNGTQEWTIKSPVGEIYTKDSYYFSVNKAQASVPLPGANNTSGIYPLISDTSNDTFFNFQLGNDDLPFPLGNLVNSSPKYPVSMKIRVQGITEQIDNSGNVIQQSSSNIHPGGTSSVIILNLMLTDTSAVPSPVAPTQLSSHTRAFAQIRIAGDDYLFDATKNGVGFSAETTIYDIAGQMLTVNGVLESGSSFRVGTTDLMVQNAGNNAVVYEINPFSENPHPIVADNSAKIFAVKYPAAATNDPSWHYSSTSCKALNKGGYSKLMMSAVLTQDSFTNYTAAAIKVTIESVCVEFHYPVA